MRLLIRLNCLKLRSASSWLIVVGKPVWVKPVPLKMPPRLSWKSSMGPLISAFDGSFMRIATP